MKTSAKITSAVLVGIDAVAVEIRATVETGSSSFSIIGPSISDASKAATQEARYRAQAALRSMQLDLVAKITVSVALPPGVHFGPSLDLPIAVAILAAIDGVPGAPESSRLPLALAWSDALIVGELALDGHVRPIRGVLAMALLAKSLGKKQVYVPFNNRFEASAVEGLEVWPLTQLADLALGVPVPIMEPIASASWTDFDFADIRGHDEAIEAFEIAAAGGLNVLLIGPPGAGKTMLARRLMGILPPMTREEQLETAQIWSAAGLGEHLVPATMTRPFRAPHHTISSAGMTGGGSPVRPGEVSLAHNGVLFLDEVPELPRAVLEEVRWASKHRMVRFETRGGFKIPARFQLVAAMNACPCGYRGTARACECSETAIASYRKRLAPIDDIFDLDIQLSPIRADDFCAHDSVEARIQRSSPVIAHSVAEARIAIKARGEFGVHTPSGRDERLARIRADLARARSAQLA